MGQIICEFYTHQMAGQWVSENGFYLREHMSISECRDFLNEMHKIYTQFEHHKKSQPRTLGYKAQVILDGMEDENVEAEMR